MSTADNSEPTTPEGGPTDEVANEAVTGGGAEHTTTPDAAEAAHTDARVEAADASATDVDAPVVDEPRADGADAAATEAIVASADESLAAAGAAAAVSADDATTVAADTVTADAVAADAAAITADEAPTEVVPDDATVALPAATDAPTQPFTDIFAPGAAATGVAASTAADAPEAAPQAQWAPAEKQDRKRRRWPWIAIPAAGVVAGLAITSTVLIAPNVSAAGVPIGGLTREAAANAIAEKLADTTLELTTDKGSAKLTAAQLGATIDANALADKAHKDFPLWNVTAWDSERLDGLIALDDAKATEALKAALPEAYVNPTEATVAFKDGTYAVTPSATGQGVEIDSVRTALQNALGEGKTTATLATKATVIDPILTTEEATAAATKLNGAIKNAGFYVGEENLVPLDAATVSSWIDFTIGDDGSVDMTVDEGAIAKVVPTLAEKVNRDAVNGTAIVDRAGGVIEEGEPSQTGRKLGDTTGIAAAFAKQIAEGKGVYELPVEVTEPTVTGIEKWIDINLSNQTVTAYENGKAVLNVAVSTGTTGWETHTGEFRTNSRIYEQDMGCVDGYEWCTRDVPYVMFFNGDEGFHGTYWHNEFGRPMSHGCVNMTITDAEWLFYWAPIGTEVSVHY